MPVIDVPGRSGARACRHPYSISTSVGRDPRTTLGRIDLRPAGSCSQTLPPADRRLPTVYRRHPGRLQPPSPGSGCPQEHRTPKALHRAATQVQPLFHTLNARTWSTLCLDDDTSMWRQIEIVEVERIGVKSYGAVLGEPQPDLFPHDSFAAGVVYSRHQTARPDTLTRTSLLLSNPRTLRLKESASDTCAVNRFPST